MSKVVHCVEAGVTFQKDRQAVGSHYSEKQHIESKQWESGRPNERKNLEKGRKKED